MEEEELEWEAWDGAASRKDDRVGQRRAKGLPPPTPLASVDDLLELSQRILNLLVLSR